MTAPRLNWYVSHPLISDAYGTPYSGSGDTPEEALAALKTRLEWEKQLAEEKLAQLEATLAEQTP